MSPHRRVINKAIHLVLAINLNGEKELLGMWMSQTEGAKFWMTVLTDLKNRGVQDIFNSPAGNGCASACVDGLSGFPEAIAATFPDTLVQLCMVHMVRNSVAFVSYKDRKAVCADLKAIYSAATEDEAELNLELFAEKWDAQYPTYPTGSKLQPELESALGECDSDVFLPARDSQGDVHHQRY